MSGNNTERNPPCAQDAYPAMAAEQDVPAPDNLQRLRETLRRWRIVSARPFYGIGGIFLLWALVVAFFIVVRSLRAFGLWPYGFWYYDSVVAVFAVVGMVFYRRSELLALSRWRPKGIDFAIGAPLGVLIPLILWLLTRDPVHTAGLRLPPSSAFIPVICLGPLVEEVFCRGTILRSLKAYLPPSVAVLFATLVACLAHSHFWAVLPAQFMFSTVYVALGNSLPAAMIGHVANNAFVLLLATAPFQKWHEYLWSVMKIS